MTINDKKKHEKIGLKKIKKKKTLKTNAKQELEVIPNNIVMW